LRFVFVFVFDSTRRRRRRRRARQGLVLPLATSDVVAAYLRAERRDVRSRGGEPLQRRALERGRGRRRLALGPPAPRRRGFALGRAAKEVYHRAVEFIGVSWS
jgi:hypothetical protein